MTDYRHPLFGWELQLLSYECSRGPDFIAAALPDGLRRLLRRAATDLEQPLPPQDLSLPRISARTLLPLARHVRSMLNTSASIKETSHANPLLPNSSSSSGDGLEPSAPTTLESTAATGAGAACPAAGPVAAAPAGRGGTPC